MPSVYDYDVKCHSCSAVDQPEPPANRLRYIIAGVLILGGLGAAFGVTAGIATFGTGFVAAFVTVPLGIYFGYKGGALTAEFVDGPSCPNCGEQHDSDGLLP